MSCSRQAAICEVSGKPARPASDTLSWTYRPTLFQQSWQEALCARKSAPSDCGISGVPEVVSNLLAAMSQGLFTKRTGRGRALKIWTAAHLRHLLHLGVKKIKDELPFDTNGDPPLGSTNKLAGLPGLERRWLRPWSVVNCVFANTRCW
jgi:hypothetical protein